MVLIIYHPHKTMLIKYQVREFNTMTYTDYWDGSGSGSIGYPRGIFIDKKGLWLKSNIPLEALNSNALLQRYKPNPNNNYILQFYIQLFSAFSRRGGVYERINALTGLSAVAEINSIGGDIKNYQSALGFLNARTGSYKDTGYITCTKEKTNYEAGVGLTYYIDDLIFNMTRDDIDKIPDGYFNRQLTTQFESQVGLDNTKYVNLNMGDFGNASLKLAAENPGSDIWKALDGPYIQNGVANYTSTGIETCSVDLHFPDIGNVDWLRAPGSEDAVPVACSFDPFYPVAYVADGGDGSVGVIVTIGVMKV